MLYVAAGKNLGPFQLSRNAFFFLRILFYNITVCIVPKSLVLVYQYSFL